MHLQGRDKTNREVLQDHLPCILFHLQGHRHHILRYQQSFHRLVSGYKLLAKLHCNSILFRLYMSHYIRHLQQYFLNRKFQGS